MKAHDLDVWLHTFCRMNRLAKVPAKMQEKTGVSQSVDHWIAMMALRNGHDVCVCVLKHW